MKGLQLSEKYYAAHGIDMIEKKFPKYKDRIATGLVGEGSECFGFDDKISRDHDWGPGFCLWLTMEDYKAIGKQLQAEYEKLPQTYRGNKRLISEWGSGRVGVFETGPFYSKFIGRPEPPDSLEEWLYLPEDYLSKCTNGKVFTDPLGEFTKIRDKLLNFYPDDIRLVKIAARCMSCAQSGQYNFMRSAARKERFPLFYSEIKFCSDIISMIFLLNRRYTPFYKWMHHALQALPILGDFLYTRINDLIGTLDYKKKNEIIEHICTEVIKKFKEEGLSDSSSDFLLDHGPIIHGKIKDQNLKQRDVWLG